MTGCGCCAESAGEWEPAPGPIQFSGSRSGWHSWVRILRDRSGCELGDPLPFPPGSGSSCVVSDSDDLYLALHDSVDDIEWKLKQDKSTMAVTSLWIPLRRVNNACDCMLDFPQELTRSRQASVEIPILSLHQLDSCRRVEPNASRRAGHAVLISPAPKGSSPPCLRQCP